MAREEDRICKEYFDQPDRFSDLVNYTLYQGRAVTKPSDFKELDPVRSEVFGPDNSYEILIDNLKELSLKEDDRNIYVMIGLESQGYHDETMVVRAMKAKALLYTYQLREKVKPLKPVIII
ncbi:Rpn family recombination-promoting nuclease/putative transposase, partial [Bullifex porci]|uniref:Rpn family recombination-promoting nuclease/putative transposase n=1 Tax=Bullifex porci TaxID=2606638 RepID=UPI0023F29C3F